MFTLTQTTHYCLLNEDPMYIGHLGGSKDILSDRKYCREHTVTINVRENSSVKPEDIIHFIHENSGIGSLFVWVPKSDNLYEITVDGKTPIQYLLG